MLYSILDTRPERAKEQTAYLRFVQVFCCYCNGRVTNPVHHKSRMFMHAVESSFTVRNSSLDSPSEYFQFG